MGVSGWFGRGKRPRPHGIVPHFNKHKTCLVRKYEISHERQGPSTNGPKYEKVVRKVPVEWSQVWKRPTPFKIWSAITDRPTRLAPSTQSQLFSKTWLWQPRLAVAHGLAVRCYVRNLSTRLLLLLVPVSSRRPRCLSYSGLYTISVTIGSLTVSVTDFMLCAQPVPSSLVNYSPVMLVHDDCLRTIHVDLLFIRGDAESTLH